MNPAVAVDVASFNRFFTVLCLLATVAVGGALALWISGRWSSSARAIGDHAIELIGPQATSLAWFVAAVATAGSLYYSEVAGFVPCELCWYQRICMYPLVAVLGIGALRRDRAVRWYAGPIVAIGAGLALYHWLVERVPAFADTTSCSAVAPCTVPYFQELGFVTLAFMSLSAFSLVGTLLLVDRASERRDASGRADAREEPEPQHGAARVEAAEERV